VTSRAYILAFCGALLASTPVLAHHSFAAEFDHDKPVTVTGTVTKFDLLNPHSWIYIDVKDENGVVANWGFETAASAGQLYKRGIRKATLPPGMVVTISGFAAKDNSKTADAEKLTMADGTNMVLGIEDIRK
jgi:DNA/RNA endonuclease YhcR with UshA esterase domain